MDAATKTDQFVAQYNGRHVDEDGYYGAQCWDLVARYAREKWGCPSFPTVSGGAEGLYRIAGGPILQYFRKVANRKGDPNQLPKKGSIIVWNSSYSAPWGHTAIFLSGNGSTMTVFEQNGNNPGGNAYVTTRGWSAAIDGWLEPIEKEVNMPTLIDEEGVRILAVGILNRPEPLATTPDLKGHIGGDALAKIKEFWYSPEGKAANRWQQEAPKKIAELTQQVITANAQLQDLGKRPTQEQLDQLQATITEANKTAMEAQAKYEQLQVEKKALEDEKAKDLETGNSFIRFLGNLFNKK